MNKRLFINRIVIKLKILGKKSIIKSFVKLNLTYGKFMLELKINFVNKCGENRLLVFSLVDVRVCFFDNLISESSNSGVSFVIIFSSFSSIDDKVKVVFFSSCSSVEDKVENLAERIMEEFVEDDNEEVFYDCRGLDNEIDDDIEDVKCIEINRCVYYNMKCEK